jgi:hypothetical protein
MQIQLFAEPELQGSASQSQEEAPLGQDVGEVEVLEQRGAGLLCRRLSDSKTAWIARSQVDPESEVRTRGDRGILVIPRWLAEKIGWVQRGGRWT